MFVHWLLWEVVVVVLSLRAWCLSWAVCARDLPGGMSVYVAGVCYPCEALYSVCVHVA